MAVILRSLMSFVDRTLRVQRIVLTLTLALAALAFLRASYDVFNTVKATVIVLGAIGLAAVGAYRSARTRRIEVPVTRSWVVLGLFALGLVIGTMSATNQLRAVVGEPGRHTGLAMYLVYAGLFVLCVRLFRDHLPETLARGLLLAAVPVVVYGALQAAGIQVFDWVTFEGGPQVVSSFGNANFFAAWLGIVTPLLVWLALTGLSPLLWRIAAGAVAVAATTVAVATGSLQGVGTLVPGVAFVLVAWLWSEAPRPLARARTPIVVAGALAAVAGIVLVAVGAGPLQAVRESALRSYDTRITKWVTGWRMFSDRPLTGVGLGGDFGDWFFTYRSQALAAESGLRRSVDDPHSVVVAMFANGGLILGLAYLAFVVFTGWALFRGLRRLDGQERLALAGVGGAWVAYQVQSLVSIDIPPLAVLHWVLAGTIVGMGTFPSLRTFRLPGARPEARRQQLHPATPGSIVVIAGAALIAAAVAVTPLRADLALARARDLARDGEERAAIAAHQRATRVGRWEDLYPARAGGYLAELRFAEDARERHREAATRAPRDLVHAINIARLSVALEEFDVADRWYARALEIDPKTPEVLVEVGRFELEHGDPTRGLALAEEAVTWREEDPQVWVLVGRVRAATGDEAGAREAFERALLLDPDLESAQEGLAALSG